MRLVSENDTSVVLDQFVESELNGYANQRSQNQNGRLIQNSVKLKLVFHHSEFERSEKNIKTQKVRKNKKKWSEGQKDFHL